jgi:hypothetical protein
MTEQWQIDSFLSKLDVAAPELVDEARLLLLPEKKNAGRDSRIRALRLHDRYRQLSDYAAAEQMRKDFNHYVTTRYPREKCGPGPVVEPAKTFWGLQTAHVAGGPAFPTSWRQLLRIIAG